MTGGYEFDKALPYNLAACVEQTRLDFPEQHVAHIGAGGYWEHELTFYPEQRYLEPQQLQTDRVGMTFPQVTEALHTSLTEIPATKEYLLELRARAAAETSVLGVRLLVDAQAVANDNPNVIAPLVPSQALNPGDVAVGNKIVQELKENGYVILPASDARPAWLVISPGEEWQGWSAEHSALDMRFWAVDLDLLNQAQPGIVGRRLIEWHTASAQSEFARRALLHIDHHELPLDTLTPRFMQELAAIADPHQREAELTQCMAILDRVETMSSHGDMHQLLGVLRYDFFSMKGPLHGGVINNTGSQARLSDVLEHLQSCSGSEPGVVSKANAIEAIRQYFISWEPQAQTLSLADLSVLTNPYRYLSGQKLGSEEQEITQKFLERHGLTLAHFEGLCAIGQQPGEDRRKPLGFDLLANLVIMTQQGQADVFSPVQRALVEELFRAHTNSSEPNLPERGLQNMRTAWQVLDSRATTTEQYPSIDF